MSFSLIPSCFTSSLSHHVCLHLSTTPSHLSFTSPQLPRLPKAPHSNLFFPHLAPRSTCKSSSPAFLYPCVAFLLPDTAHAGNRKAEKCLLGLLVLFVPVSSASQCLDRNKLRKSNPFNTGTRFYLRFV
ncbi:hypothetical protein E2C01_084738 [Portunus trituberculatus]|uniref:Uncharacterized protein n=1 Tax=Portunus trituberculatus TaxID=210409 RepID=A0A5B7JA30_PORTR|nr:hypothetical protein [Portunus trituberculatus]